MRNKSLNNSVRKMKTTSYIKLINNEINTLCLEHLIDTAIPAIEQRYNEYISKISNAMEKLQNLIINEENSTPICDLLDETFTLIHERDDEYLANLDNLPKIGRKFENKLYNRLKVLLMQWLLYNEPTKKEETQIDFVLMNTSMKITNSYNNILMSCQNNFKDYLIQVSEIRNLYIEHYNSVVEKYNTEQPVNELQLNQLQNNLEQSKNLFDYKELNKLAEQYDYFYDRQKGSHAQFKHKDTGKLITIPQGRDIGKGLSCKIQKDIQTEKMNIF